MNRIATTLVALSLAACSSTQPDCVTTGAITRAECPRVEGQMSTLSCDGVDLIPVDRAGGIAMSLGPNKGPICLADGPSCPAGGEPQCTYIPEPSSDDYIRARDACRAVGFDAQPGGPGFCYVDPTTFEVVEIDWVSRNL